MSESVNPVSPQDVIARLEAACETVDWRAIGEGQASPVEAIQHVARAAECLVVPAEPDEHLLRTIASATNVSALRTARVLDAFLAPYRSTLED